MRYSHVGQDPTKKWRVDVCTENKTQLGPNNNNISRTREVRPNQDSEVGRTHRGEACVQGGMCVQGESQQRRSTHRQMCACGVILDWDLSLSR